VLCSFYLASPLRAVCCEQQTMRCARQPMCTKFDMHQSHAPYTVCACCAWPCAAGRPAPRAHEGVSCAEPVASQHEHPTCKMRLPTGTERAAGGPVPSLDGLCMRLQQVPGMRVVLQTAAPAPAAAAGPAPSPAAATATGWLGKGEAFARGVGVHAPDEHLSDGTDMRDAEGVGRQGVGCVSIVSSPESSSGDLHTSRQGNGLSRRAVGLRPSTALEQQLGQLGQQQQQQLLHGGQQQQQQQQRQQGQGAQQALAGVKLPELCVHLISNLLPFRCVGAWHASLQHDPRRAPSVGPSAAS